MNKSDQMVYDKCILLVTTTLTRESADRLRVAQRAMECTLLGISLIEIKRLEEGPELRNRSVRRNNP